MSEVKIALQKGKNSMFLISGQQNDWACQLIFVSFTGH